MCCFEDNAKEVEATVPILEGLNLLGKGKNMCV